MRGEALDERGVLLELFVPERDLEPLAAYVADGWKIIVERPEDGGETRTLLFDRTRDPRERRNVAAEKPYGDPKMSEDVKK